MKSINITVTALSLLFAGGLSAEESKVTEVNEVTAQTVVVSSGKANESETNVEAKPESNEQPEPATQPVLIEQSVDVQSDPDDEWTLMNQLIEAKKKNEAKAKATIDNLTQENTQLYVEVEENNVELAQQEQTIGGLEIQLQSLQTSAADIESRLAIMQENTDTVSYEFKKLKFKNTTSMLTPFLYAATAIFIADKMDAGSDSKLIYGLGAFSAGTLIESTDYGLSFQLTKVVYKK
ncbi:hypothetical protein [Marinicellulosiphila megalodicopiae]|uniref:hypothetical protein n=1 Tax=Marinicellulosiphila megalodicopiae TaxID=2724896 RepID=UPI003BB051FE